MRDAIGFRQQLSTTSFEAFELDIVVNYPVYTWTENGSFTRNLTNWSVPFWLVLLTEHDVLHCFAPNAVYRCVVARQTRLADYLLADCRCFQVSDPSREIHAIAFVRHTALTDKCKKKLWFIHELTAHHTSITAKITKRCYYSSAHWHLAMCWWVITFL